MSSRQLLPDMHPEQCPNSDHIFYNKRWDSFNCSNFLDVDLLSSSGNSCEEETFERSALINSPFAGLSLDNVINEKVETGAFASDSEPSLKGQEHNDVSQSSGSLTEFSDRFVHWVTHGEVLFP
jgi:hypothetical protein